MDDFLFVLTEKKDIIMWFYQKGIFLICFIFENI